MEGAVTQRDEAGNFRQLGRIQQYGAVFGRLVFLADSCVLYVTLYLSVRLVGLPWTQRYVTLALLGILLFGAVVSFRTLYGTWRLPRLRVELAETAWLLTVTFTAIFAVLLVATPWIERRPNLLMFGLWFVLALLGMALVRFVMRLMLRVYRIGPSRHRRVAFLGVTRTALRLAELFQAHSWMGVDVAGFYDPAEQADEVQDLLARARRGEVSAVYITLPASDDVQLAGLVNLFADTTASIYYCPTLLNLDPLNAHWDNVFGHPVISIVTSPFDGWGRHLKRLEDLALAIVILPIIALPLLAIAAAIKLTSPGPVLYLQSRHGLGGKTFKICKFRTMYTVDADHEFVQARKNDARITPIGGFLRRTSLDELPQFYNVLIGEMSVVGPRPAPLKYNEDHRLIIHRYMVRHKVKPGITGLAQVSGSRGETESVSKTEERTMLDLRYIANWSLWLDLKIVFKTAVMTLTDNLPR